MSRSGRSTGRLVSAALGVAVQAGCALSKPPTHPEVVEQALPKTTTIPPAWSAATDASPVTDDWLASFKDPGLDAVVAEGIANNLDLRQAAARVEAAQQTVVIVGSKLYPQIGAQIGLHGTIADQYATTSQSNQDTFYGANAEYIGVFWEVDLWGRLRAQRAAAEATFEGVALEYAFARQSLAATVAKSWYLAIETRQLLDPAQESVQIYTQLLELVRVRQAAGIALLPSFALSLDGGHVSNGLTLLLRINPWLLFGTVGMSIPIYTGGALTGQIEIATAQQVQVIARYGAVALRAFYEVEVALTNETLLAERLLFEEQGLGDRTEAVRIAKVRYVAGAMDMLSLLQLQERQLDGQAAVIQLRNARLANRITLHLALGGSFEAAPAVPLAAAPASGP